MSPIAARTALVTALLASAVPAQNSMRKVRPEPSALAARAGTAVRWRESLDAALAEAKESGRPVFWYVPTLRGSPMDRKPEIDRYMMAGPFSWPRTIELLNERFVPVRQVAGRAEQRRYELASVRFIEPGYLVLDGDGGERARLDRISTFHPGWFLRRLGALVGVEVAPEVRFPGRLPPADARAAYAAADPELELSGLEPALRAEARYLLGAGLFHSGREFDASSVWRRLAEDQPDHPLAWKAQAEAEGHGPLVHGFETYEALAPAALEPSAAGSRAAPEAYSDASLRRLSAAFLTRMQRSHGGWVDSRYDFGGTDSLPNVHTAVSALATQALLEVMVRQEVPDLEVAVARGLAFVADETHLNRDDRDEIVWAFLYRARLYCRWLDLRPDDAAPVRELLRAAVRDLCAIQLEDGAWRHEYPNPFVICSVLVALADAERHGVSAPGDAVERGLRAALRCRAKDGAVPYSYVRRGTARAQIAAGVGRMPLMEHSLALWGRGEDGALQNAVDVSFRFHDEVAKVRKYDDHASRLGYGGFFFWYDMHVRGEAIALMPDGDARTNRQNAQRAQILALPEFDGCFVDSHELGRVYGTAMALICLDLTER